MNRKISATVVAGVVAAGIVAAPAPALAAGGCSYPKVCVYHGTQMTRPSGRFQDVTSGWQYFGRSFGTKGVRNTRHDDVAYLKTTTGRVVCVRPGRTGGLMEGGFTAIRISTSRTC